MSNERRFIIFAWLLSIFVAALAFISWGQRIAWNTSNISSYSLFPLFGLLAFSIMWSHYIVAAGKKFHGLESNVTKKYFEITSLVVLFAICVHPGIFWWQLWRDGFGLPPLSYWHYLGEPMHWFGTLGTIALLTFLAYEFRRKFNKKPWWKYVQYASDGAMILILVHSLKLGGNLQMGWLRDIWYFYGVTFIAALFYLYGYKKPENKKVA